MQPVAVVGGARKERSRGAKEEAQESNHRVIPRTATVTGLGDWGMCGEFAWAEVRKGID